MKRRIPHHPELKGIVSPRTLPAAPRRRTDGSCGSLYSGDEGACEHGDWRVAPRTTRAEDEHLPTGPSVLKRVQMRATYLDETPVPAAATLDADGEWSEPLRWRARALRITVALFVLLPLSVIMVFALMMQIYHARPVMELASFWLSVPVWHTLLGAFVLLVCMLRSELRTILLYLYVAGHELTHAIATIICLGKVKRFRVGLDGGYVETDKANLFIALSPYFVPIWMLLWLLIFWVLQFAYPGVESQIFLYTGFGFWWCFHIYWTLWVIPREQPDMLENGVIFSSLIIFLLNLGLLILVLSWCSLITPEGYWRDFLYCARRIGSTFAELGAWLMSLC